MVKEFQNRRNFLVDQLNLIDNIQCKKPGGAFYVFPNFKNYLNSKSSIVNLVPLLRSLEDIIFLPILNLANFSSESNFLLPSPKDNLTFSSSVTSTSNNSGVNEN